MNIPVIKIEDYEYDLPPERIAQYPVKERDMSKLLIYKDNSILVEPFRDIAGHIPADSLLVFNNTRVIKARFIFRKDSGARIEVFCLEPLSPADYEHAFSSRGPVEWKCIIGNLKKWKSGRLSMQFRHMGKDHLLTAEKKSPEGEAWRVRFSWEENELSFGDVAETAGHIPLPPYVKREDEKEDNIRYQTVYSKIDGSVAAPTAGLHFTENVLETIYKRGIGTTELTLHIGAGTFKPVKTNDISEHEMHCEHFVVSRQLIEEIKEYEGRVIAVGTTSVRTLESLYWTGVKILKEKSGPDAIHTAQWEPYRENCSVTFNESFSALITHMDENKTDLLHGSTTLIIIPGYRFRVIRGMITNFHQPRSTLLLLVAAYAGENWKKIYEHALEHNFRFLSFGDTSLLLAHNHVN
ncbi:MAG: S-adenosylmethionine:tRNA ribosyltransferase-isomerase [Bacteroidales bacterium]|nr:S-adenosylmethionine:tRNA ribosyltransferase-isomerase [Bacteroidales bacterium]